MGSWTTPMATAGRIRLLVGAAIAVSLPSSAAAEAPSFKATVAPLLVDHCIACHNAKKAEGGYRLDSFAALEVAGDSGVPPIVAGPQPGGELLRRITSDDPDERMPPETPALPESAVTAIREWLAGGGTFDGPRATEPLNTVMPPRMQAAPAAYRQPIPVTALMFHADGRELFVGGYHEVLVFDVETGSLARRLGGAGQRVTAVRPLADGRTIAVAGGEPGRHGDVRLVDAASGVVTRVMARAADVILDAAPRPGGGELAVAGTDGILRVVDLTSGTELRAISSHGDWVTAVAWSDDGRRLASASRDKTVKVFDAGSGELIATFSGHGAPVRGVALSADGSQAFSTGDDRRFHRWSAEDGTPVGGPMSLPGAGLRVVRDGGTVFVPHAGPGVAVITLATNAVATVAQPEWPLAVAAHAASGRMATGSIDGEVRVFALGAGTFLRAWTARP